MHVVACHGTVSWGFWNKLSHTWGLKTTEIDSGFRSQESDIEVSAGPAPYEAVGRTPPCLFRLWPPRRCPAWGRLVPVSASVVSGPPLLSSLLSLTRTQANRLRVPLIQDPELNGIPKDPFSKCHIHSSRDLICISPGGHFIPHLKSKLLDPDGSSEE